MMKVWAVPRFLIFLVCKLRSGWYNVVNELLPRGAVTTAITKASSAVSCILKKIAAGMSIVVHPFLYASVPVVGIYGYNMQELSISDLAIPLAVALASALALFFLSLLAVRNAKRAGIVVTMLVVLFYTYGVVGYLLAPRVRWDPDMLLLPLWGLLFAVGVVLVMRIRWNTRKLTIILNVAAVSMVLVPAVRIGVGEARRLDPGSECGVAAIYTQLREPDRSPDIYYIILDSYAGSEYLADAYGYNNEAFLDYLGDKGFYVATASRSNYSSTWLSLASSLNMDYISNLGSESDMASQYWFSLTDLVVDNRVMTLLKSVGYKYVCLDTYQDPTERSPRADLEVDVSGSSLSSFQRVLVEFSMASAVWHDTVDYREHVLKAFNELEGMPEVEGPKFVFAHILCPHWPYVFDADGGPVDLVDWRQDPERSEKYLDQITFVNKKVELVIDQILSSSTTPPIIILQGDHGPRFERSSDNGDPAAATARDAHMILNAVYLPQGGAGLMYESISPVNTFRVVFNYYFGADLPLLDDESYLSVSRDPFPLVNVSDKLG